MYNLSLTPKRSQEIIQRRTASCKRHQNSDKLPAYGKHRRGLCRKDCIQQESGCGKIGEGNQSDELEKNYLITEHIQQV